MNSRDSHWGFRQAHGTLASRSTTTGQTCGSSHIAGHSCKHMPFRAVCANLTPHTCLQHPCYPLSYPWLPLIQVVSETDNMKVTNLSDKSPDASARLPNSHALVRQEAAAAFCEAAAFRSSRKCNVVNSGAASGSITPSSVVPAISGNKWQRSPPSCHSFFALSPV